MHASQFLCFRNTISWQNNQEGAQLSAHRASEISQAASEIAAAATAHLLISHLTKEQQASRRRMKKSREWQRGAAAALK